MRKLLVLICAMLLALPLTACGKVSTDDKPEAQGESIENTTPITLTIGDTVLQGYLNNSEPAQSLIAQLPLTVTLNDSGNDFCGGNLNIAYSGSDVQSGYKNGDLAFWPPANNFVIFVDNEENSAGIGDLVMLGKITESQEALDALKGRIEVKIALADGGSSTKETEKIYNNQIKNSKAATTANEWGVSDVKVRIVVGDKEAIATLENNATTQAIVKQMPMTLPMMDLYGREMCYRYGPYALPTDSMRSDGYDVGDIAYWAPGGSLVILYAQNGERFERQHLGHIDSGVELFKDIGDSDVRFELME